VSRFLMGDTELEVDERAALALDVAEIAPGSFVLRHAGGEELFHCVRVGNVVHLWWRGVAYRLEEAGEGPRASQRGAGGLEAPMPGKVIAVKKAAGDPVVKGEEILIVEAMKMENAIRAPRDGRIKAIAAKVGDMVAPGTVLVELE
jgi:acetyl/propionyl-CoA carboxylase alpha subunit